MNKTQEEKNRELHEEVRKLLEGPSKDPIVLAIMAELSANILTIAYDEKSPSAQGLFFAIGMAANALATAVASDDIPVEMSKRSALEIMAFCMSQTVVLSKISASEKSSFTQMKPGSFH